MRRSRFQPILVSLVRLPFPNGTTASTTVISLRCGHEFSMGQHANVGCHPERNEVESRDLKCQVFTALACP